MSRRDDGRDVETPRAITSFSSHESPQAPQTGEKDRIFAASAQADVEFLKRVWKVTQPGKPHMTLDPFEPALGLKVEETRWRKEPHPFADEPPSIRHVLVNVESAYDIGGMREQWQRFRVGGEQQAPIGQARFLDALSRADELRQLYVDANDGPANRGKTSHASARAAANVDTKGKVA